jgi:type IV secretory pathway ATPase VirB11/archaellum biosynthesis ATPase
MILAADPPGAGKTTILTALLAFAKPDASVYFTRGWGETFRLPPPPAANEAPIYLMVNEMSDHLPVYSWGPYVQRAFELAAEGYTLMSTMHADDVAGVVEQLTDECDVDPKLIGHLAFVVPMFVGANNGRRVRRIDEIAVLEPLGSSHDSHSIVRWRRDEDAFDVLSTPAEINAAARRLDLSEDDLLEALGAREKFLQSLLDEGVTEIEQVQRRVLEFSGYRVLD